MVVELAVYLRCTRSEKSETCCLLSSKIDFDHLPYVQLSAIVNEHSEHQTTQIINFLLHNLQNLQLSVVFLLSLSTTSILIGKSRRSIVKIDWATSKPREHSKLKHQMKTLCRRSINLNDCFVCLLISRKCFFCFQSQLQSGRKIENCDKVLFD